MQTKHHRFRRMLLPVVPALILIGLVTGARNASAHHKWPPCHATISRQRVGWGAHVYDWIYVPFTVESSVDYPQYHCYLSAWSDDNSIVVLQSPTNSYSETDFELDPEGLGTVWAYFRAGDIEGDTDVHLGIGDSYDTTPVQIYNYEEK